MYGTHHDTNIRIMQQSTQTKPTESTAYIAILLLLLLLLLLLCGGMVGVNCAILKVNTDINRNVVKIVGGVEKIINMTELKENIQEGKKDEKVTDLNKKRKRLNQFLNTKMNVKNRLWQ